MRLKLLALSSAALLAALVSAPRSGPAQQFTFAQVEAIKKAVVRIDATGCPDKGRRATGFFWRQSSWVVTALHAVNGCTILNVHSEKAGKGGPAHIVKVLRKQDLVLLQVDAIPSTTLLPSATASPELGDTLQAIGYRLGIPAMDNTTVHLRAGGRTLGEIVTPDVKSELRQLGSPDPDIEIDSLESHLEPGISGAPIVNSQGQVVAIADGGLEHGIGGDSWALPQTYLPLLANSNEDRGAVSVTQSQHLFSAEIDLHDGGTINCGGGVFRNIRTMKFQDILHATDDPQGLMQIVNYFGPDTSQFQFDIYLEEGTGASFAVPHGAAVTASPRFCVATTQDGLITIRISVSPTGADATGQQISMAYQANATGEDGTGTFGWVIDPTSSYAALRSRFDGFIVWRDTYQHLAQIGNPNSMNEVAFETLAVRRGVFLGVSAITHNWTPQLGQEISTCRVNPYYNSYCSQAVFRGNLWAQAVIAVHLSTFVVG